MSGYELKHYLKSINETKEHLLDSDDPMWEKKYSPFIINKCLAPFNETIIAVNEMNQRHHLDKKLQYDFLLNSISKRKRFDKWQKADKSEDLDYVRAYFNYSYPKAVSALRILSQKQIDTIKEKVTNKGGVK